MKSIIQSDTILPSFEKSRPMFWNGTGWTEVKRRAKIYRTFEEINSALDRMNADMVFAKPVNIK